MKEHENILIFGIGKIKYTPIMQERIGHRKNKETTTIDSGRTNSVYGTQNGLGLLKVNKLRNPRSIQRFNRERGLHPTQKPVDLFEYLIKTYTHEGDTVLDNCAGSFTTAIAAENTKRNWICIEQLEEYCEIGKKRIEENRKKLST